MQSKQPNKSSSGDLHQEGIFKAKNKYANFVNPNHSTEIKRFIESLNQAMVMHDISQRKLGDEIGVSIGTVTKYLRGEVNPFDVRSRITRNTSESKDLPRILSALSVSQKKLQGDNSSESKVVVEKNAEPPKPSKAEIAKFGKQLAIHFQKIRKYEALNTRETWKLFLKQDYAKSISKKHLEQIQDILTGEIELTMDILIGFGKAHGRCPIYMVFSRMSETPFSSELETIHSKVVTWHCFHLTGQIPENVESIYE